MNMTERKAKSWLIKNCGYGDDDIKFTWFSSPDFELPADGTLGFTGFEVKRVDGFSLTIPVRQWAKLINQGNCVLGLFKDGIRTPVTLIPVNSLNPPDTWEGYHIRLIEPHNPGKSQGYHQSV